jgi:hypothetical protein
MDSSCYIRVGEDGVRLGNEAIEAGFAAGNIAAGDMPYLEVLLNKITGTRLNLAPGRECCLHLVGAGSSWHIPEWRFAAGSGHDVAPEDEQGFRSGFHLPLCDDRDWMVVHRLTEFPIGGPGYSTVLYPGYAWYRGTVQLPAECAGLPLDVTLGGYDSQDWLYYTVYLNGVPAGNARPFHGWHEPPCYRLEPGRPAYAALRFGQANIIAVQAQGLDRRQAGMSLPDAERFSVGSLLAEQSISVGQSRRAVEDFLLVEQQVEAEPGRAGLRLRLKDAANGLSVEVRYWLVEGEAALHKQVMVLNQAQEEQTLLDIDLAHVQAALPASPGGLGMPVTMGGEFFFGIAHPAGIAAGDERGVTLTLWPGRKLPPGGSYASKEAVYGVSRAGGAEEAFVAYLAGRSPRRREPLAFYHTYGMHDIAGVDDPTPLTEGLVANSLDRLAALAERGVQFDYYWIDAGWSDPHGDLRGFDPRNFPDGPGALLRRAQGMGMKVGLWTAPASGPMAFHPQVSNPRYAPCGTLPARYAGAPDAGVPQHRGALCLLAEPWRSDFTAALLYHVRENGVRGYKFDGNAFVCHNPTHGHLPGRYSIEPLTDALIGAMMAVEEACGDAFFMFYWSIRSPWWLLFGDTLYERGILMEAATGCDFPAPHLRQSANVSFDQAAHLAWDRAPLSSHDSLGVWLSETRWASWMGAEGWQDAWLMDIARGSLLRQLWGDLNLLGAQDAEFLAAVEEWLRRDGEMLGARPRRILGSPWRAEPYGYAYGDGRRSIVFLYNPTFQAQTVFLDPGPDLALVAPPAGEGWAIRSLYPGREQRPCSPGLALPQHHVETVLQPFEVAFFEVASAGVEARAAFPAAVIQRERSLALPLVLDEVASEPCRWDDPSQTAVLRRAVNGRAFYSDSEEAFRLAALHSDERDRSIVHSRLAGHVQLPPVAENDVALLLMAQLARDGTAWHHHALFDIVRLVARTGSRELPMRTAPERWHEQAGGWSWILFTIPLEPGAQRTVSLEVDTYLPASVAATWQAWLYRPHA